MRSIMGPVSDTYRADLAMLQPRIPDDLYAQLVKLAEDIQDARARGASDSAELDRRIAVYLSVREDALAQATDPTLGG
ncbi:hypothetical protein [Microbacterium sp. ZW T5_56]|uniref:hypothetical protein n=1 Tax=Microbacterium sp. ZW T5_56 TaxID=3378081 RepID=UPI0038547391